MEKAIPSPPESHGDASSDRKRQSLHRMSPIALKHAKGKKDINHISRGDPDAAEARNVAHVRRSVVDTTRSGALCGISYPATATLHTFVTAGRTMRVSLCVSGIEEAIFVPAPFIHISAHVKDAKLIGGLAAYRMCGAGGIGMVPANFVQIIAPAIGVIVSLITAPGGKLPFHLCWQAIAIGSPVAVYIAVVVINFVPSLRPVTGIGAIIVTINIAVAWR